MYSDLETLVNNELYALGLDPSNPDHIDAYWEVMLNGN